MSTDESALEELKSYHACFSGDCPHVNFVDCLEECFHQGFDAGRKAQAELTKAQMESLYKINDDDAHAIYLLEKTVSELRGEVLALRNERQLLIGELGHAIPTLPDGQEYATTDYKNVLASFIAKERDNLTKENAELRAALTVIADDLDKIGVTPTEINHLAIAQNALRHRKE
jgi:hypothetical protein